MKFLLNITAALLLSACSSTNLKPELEKSMGGIPSTQYSDATTIEEIRKLRPQAQLPLKIAVLSPRGYTLSKDEHEALDNWSKKLKTLGFAENIDIIPAALIPSCSYNHESRDDCFLKQARIAGARLGADALLFLNAESDSDSYVNPLSLLNITIIGMWLVPAHHRDAYALYEASLFDINNGYLYAVAQGDGEYQTVRPYMYTAQHDGEDEARTQALNKLGEKLYSLAQEQMRKLKEKP